MNRTLVGGQPLSQLVEAEPNVAFFVHLSNGDQVGMEVTMPLIDWAQYETLRETDADTFPPSLAVRVQLPVAQIDRPSWSERLSQACVDAGHGHLLARPHTERHASPAFWFAEQGCVAALVIAMEQGADPFACGPRLSAWDAARDQPQVRAAIRSHLARAAATEALAGCHISSFLGRR